LPTKFGAGCYKFQLNFSEFPSFRLFKKTNKYTEFNRIMKAGKAIKNVEVFHKKIPF